MRKKILLCSEATFLNTGYATYGREIMKRLYEKDKYELAEFSSYGSADDERASSIPWRYYPNLPDENDEQRRQEYVSAATNQFGEWRFEHVLLDFKPDIVFDIRDFWMMDYQERSPFRRLFHWAVMPTVDAYPQNEQWLGTYANANAVFNYSEFGMETLLEESDGRINCRGVASPSADAAYKPVSDKFQHKEAMGFDGNCKIIGTVMRNQRRKLYPDLFEAFAKFIQESGREDVYLYCHTSYPDLGWDIPKLLKQHGICSKTLFTYVCANCRHWFPSFFQDAVCRCNNCGQHAASLSNVQKGVDTEDLAQIVNLFDLYVQYANSEGFGLPQVEAAACGVFVMSVDYSAMSSVVRNLEGEPLKLITKYLELETGCYRAIPDNDYACQKMVEFFNLPDEEIARKGAVCRKNFVEKYQWDASAQKWEEHFDAVYRPPEDKWNSPPEIFQPATQMPTNMDNKDLARWLIVNVLGDETRLDSYMESRMVRDLNYGVYIEGTGDVYINEDSMAYNRPQFKPFGPEEAYKAMYEIRMKRNYWENIRGNMARESL
tara:strand:- start:57072 stop:58712 length:1641 start_codon:yes stop_codon:yes gene_type:complete